MRHGFVFCLKSRIFEPSAVVFRALVGVSTATMKHRRIRFLIRFWIAALAAVGWSIAAAAQTASVRGTVVDAVTGRGIEGAAIELRAGSRALGTAVSGRDGAYAVPNLPEGLAALTVRRNGYLDAREAEVRTVAGQVTRLDVELVRRPAALEEIVVSAKAVGRPQASSVTANRLTREEIRRGAGTAGDVFRGLDVLPGVASTGEFSNFTVRGRGPRDNLILIDGIPFDKVVHFDRSLGEEEDIGGGGRFAIFAQNVVGSAEFQAGGWSAAQGGRNGSLLALNVAEGNPDSASLGARVDIGGAELTYDGPSYFADNTSLVLSARAFDFGTTFDLIGQDDLGDPELADLLFKSVTDVSDNHRVSLLALYSPERFERDLDNVLASPDFEDVALLNTRQDSALAALTWRWLVGRDGRLTNAIYLRDSDKNSRQGEVYPDQRVAGGAIRVRPDILTIDENEREIGWRADYTAPTGLGVLSLGARVERLSLDFTTRLAGDWIRYIYDRDDFRPSPTQKFVLLTPARVNAAFDDAVTRGAVYADHTFELGAVTVRPGLRFDRDGIAKESLWSPRLAIDWFASDATRIVVTGGVYYQTPRFLDVAADPSNNRLRSERSTQASLGVEHFLNPDTKATAEIYVQDLGNLTVAGDETSGLFTNSGVGSAKGIDLGLQRRLASDWSASLAYSYSRARRDDKRGEGPYPADFNRPHVVTLAGSWQPNDRWAFAAKWKFASGRPTDGFIINRNIFNDPMFMRFSKEIVSNNTARLRDFHALNARVDYRRRFGGVSLIAFLDVINVYGRRNIDSLEFDERRGVNVFGDFSVFPQIGLKVEF
jgi:hypothetical protein